MLRIVLIKYSTKDSNENNREKNMKTFFLCVFETSILAKAEEGKWGSKPNHELQKTYSTIKKATFQLIEEGIEEGLPNILGPLSRVTNHPTFLVYRWKPHPQKTFGLQANQDSCSPYFMLQYLGVNFLKSTENFYKGLLKNNNNKVGFYLGIVHKKLPLVIKGSMAHKSFSFILIQHIIEKASLKEKK